MPSPRPPLCNVPSRSTDVAGVLAPCGSLSLHQSLLSMSSAASAAPDALPSGIVRVFVEGTLLKRPASGWGPWHRRFFRIRGTQLSCADAPGGAVKWTLDLTAAKLLTSASRWRLLIESRPGGAGGGGRGGVRGGGTDEAEEGLGLDTSPAGGGSGTGGKPRPGGAPQNGHPPPGLSGDSGGRRSGGPFGRAASGGGDPFGGGGLGSGGGGGGGGGAGGGPPGGRKLTLAAESAADYDTWLEALTSAMQWKVTRFYDVSNQSLGEGAFGRVRKGIRRSDGLEVAVKTIGKARLDEDDYKYLIREVAIAQAVAHPCIMSTYGVFETDTSLHIVSEFMSGGTLAQVMAAWSNFTEEQARGIVHELMHGIAYLHSIGTVHRYVPEAKRDTGRGLHWEAVGGDAGERQSQWDGWVDWCGQESSSPTASRACVSGELRVVSDVPDMVSCAYVWAVVGAHPGGGTSQSLSRWMCSLHVA